jgi:hypothetical protein
VQNVIGNCVWSAADFAFPGTNYGPTEFFSQVRRPFVAFAVPLHLGRPQLSVRAGPRGLAPMLWACVPETPVDKHSQTPAGKQNVGSAALGQPAVKPEPGPGGVECLTKGDLGSRALAAAA